MTLVYIFAFIVGAVMGSFLNVVGLRFLKEMSLVNPGSHCYQCQTPIKPYDNIPILSWLILKGQCRNCKAPISIQYPVIEALTGLLFVATLYTFGLSWQSGFILYLIANFIVIFITDFREQYIYDINSLGLIPFGLVYSFLNLGDLPGSVSFFSFSLPASFTSALTAVASVFVLFFVLNLVSCLLIGKRGFGEGDTRLLMGIGAFFGLPFTMWVFLISFIIQVCVGIPLLLKQWVQHKAYWPAGLLLLSFVLAGAPYLFQAWLNQSGVLLPIVLASCGAAMFCSLKSLKLARNLSIGLTYLPFGPAIVIACLILIFFQVPLLAWTSSLLEH